MVSNLKVIIMNTEEIIENMVQSSHHLYKKGLVPGKAGNISVKFVKDDLKLIAVTPSGASLKYLEKKDIVLVDLDGNIVSSSNNVPTSELEMHLNIYNEREDINAVVHTHSPITTGFAFSDEKIEMLEGFGPIKCHHIPTVDYYPPGSVELANAVSIGLKNENVVVLKNHGMVALGKNLDEATLLSEFIEDIAKIQFVKKILMSDRF